MPEQSTIQDITLLEGYMDYHKIGIGRQNFIIVNRERNRDMKVQQVGDDGYVLKEEWKKLRRKHWLFLQPYLDYTSYCDDITSYIPFQLCLIYILLIIYPSFRVCRFLKEQDTEVLVETDTYCKCHSITWRYLLDFVALKNV